MLAVFLWAFCHCSWESSLMPVGKGCVWSNISPCWSSRLSLCQQFSSSSPGSREGETVPGHPGLRDFQCKHQESPGKLGQLVTLALGHQRLVHTPWATAGYCAPPPAPSHKDSSSLAVHASDTFLVSSSTMHLRKICIFLILYSILLDVKLWERTLKF